MATTPSKTLPPLVGCMLSLALLAAGSPASAQGDPEENLSEVREMILFARYDEAIAAAEALAGASGLTARQINSALELLATARIATGDEDEARAALSRLYSRDPRHRLSDPDVSPHVASFFARARESADSPVEVSLSWGLRPSDSREAPGVAVRIDSGADAVQEVRLSYRQGSDPSFHRIEMTREETGAFKARIPLLSATGDEYDVSFVIEAFAPSRAPLAQLGSEVTPLSLTVRSADAASGVAVGSGSGQDSGGERVDEGGGIASKWWFWTLLVAIVAGGVVAAVVLGPGSSGPEEGSLGSATLGLTF
jgi:hypothetical protein